MIKHTTKNPIVLTLMSMLIAWVVLPTSAQAVGSLSLSHSQIKELTGEAANDAAGYDVSTAGDVNGDGYDDILVGAYDHGATGSGAAYLVYGQSSAITDTTLNATNTVKFSGELNAYAGWSVASAGDVNGDGYDDILIGEPTEAGGQSAVYLIYGQSAALTDITLNAANTVKFSNETESDQLGTSVASAGDVNNDGYDDVLLGAVGNTSGQVYLLYGRAEALSDITVSASNSTKFTGESSGDGLGASVTSAGDVNNDGYEDILLGAPYNDASSNTDAGAAYLIYGQSAELSDATVSSSTSVKLSGASASITAGISVASADDVNNDGYNDIIIGASLSDSGAGAAFLLYGQSASLDDMTLNATTTTKFLGETAGDNAGISVDSAGDTNNDGYDDIIIGANQTDIAASNSGSAYVVQGQSTALTDITLSDTTAIELNGVTVGNQTGYSVASAGDVNNDGYADLLIGAPFGEVAYLLYPQASTVTLTGDNSQTLECTATYTDPGATATDQYTSSSLSVSASTLSNTTLGAQTITYTSVANFFNIQGTTTRTVTVEDTVDPTITLTGDATVSHEAGTDYSNPGATATDTCDTDPVVTSTELDVQTLGEQTLTYTATDHAGNTATTSRTVTVQDTIAPVITLAGDATLYVAIGDTYTDEGASATDSFVGDMTDDVIVTNPVDTSTAGTYTVVYAVSDPSGNAATEVSRTVIVAPLRVTTNGKFVRVFIGDELLDRERINKKRFKRRYFKLKTSSFYEQYTTVAVLTAKKTEAKLTVLRLTSDHTLRKKVAKSFDIEKRNKVSLRFKSSKKRIIAAVGKGEAKTTDVYKLTRKGRLKNL